jgi:hypothetical protein
MYTRMCKYFGMLGMVLALVVGSGFGFTPIGSNAVASATSSCKTLPNGTQECNITKVASADSNGSFNVTSHVAVTTKGKTTLEYQVKTGYTVSGAKCYKEPSFSKVPKGAKCWIATKKGYKYSNSGVSQSGVRTYFGDVIGSGYSPVGSKFYYDSALHTWRKANCGNFVRFSGTEALQVQNVVLLRSFSQLRIKLMGYINKSLSEVVKAQAECSSNGTSASATAYGSDKLVIKISVSATASSYASAKAQANAQALKTASSEDMSLQDTVNAAALDNLEVSVSVSCQAITPPPPAHQCQPPSTGTYPNCITPVAPSASAQAQACVNAGASNGVITGIVLDNNSSADTAVINIGSKTITVSVPAHGSANFTLSGFAPGSYLGTALLQTVGLSATFGVTVQQCSVVTPPPVQHYVQISCTWQEEITVGGSSYTRCVVTDDNGANIALSVSTDANSRASGISCISNGTPSCSSGETYEFLLQGLIAGNTTVVATATANGVSATSSDTMPVDPASEGF